MENNANRNYWIDYLRSFLTVLVVAHHSSLAYTTFAYFEKGTYINSTNPIVDPSRWIGMDVFENFNDIFFMSLMFLISGIFVFRGINKKGRWKFLTDRVRRLGLPFIIAVTFIIPFAYLPSFYLVNHSFNALDFIKDYILHQQWPVGPPWFIWILLLFNIIAVAIPSNFYVKISNIAAGLAKRPFLFLVVIFIIVLVAYMPISLWVGQYTWTGFGPFDFQVNRVLLYFVFFFFGACMGSRNWESDLFNNGKLLAKSWQFWAALCIVCYLLVELFTFHIWDYVRAGRMTVNTAWLILDLLFVASCIASIFAFIAGFKQKIKRPFKIWTNLSANAFGIYLVHYIFITWFQFLLVGLPLPVIVKFLMVFVFSVLLSWAIINWARKFKAVNRII